MSVFAKAIELLRECGWSKQSVGGKREESHCALGAMYFATNEKHEVLNTDPYKATPHMRALAQAIHEEHPDRLLDPKYQHVSAVVWRYNDSVAKDVDEVIHTMKRAEEIMDGEREA